MAIVDVPSFIFGAVLAGISIWTMYNNEVIDVFQNELLFGKENINENHFINRREYKKSNGAGDK